MPKKKRDIELAKKLAGQPCVVCKNTMTCGDHIKTRGSGGECHEDNLWALCMKHHNKKGEMGLATFVASYQLEEVLLEKNWEYDYFSNKWIRITSEGWDD